LKVINCFIIRHILHFSFTLKISFDHDIFFCLHCWNVIFTSHDVTQGDYNVLSKIVTRDVSQSEKDIIWSHIIIRIIVDNTKKTFFQLWNSVLIMQLCLISLHIELQMVNTRPPIFNKWIKCVCLPICFLWTRFDMSEVVLTTVLSTFFQFLLAVLEGGEILPLDMKIVVHLNIHYRQCYQLHKTSQYLITNIATFVVSFHF
jgi:hypothetical protein